MNWRERQALPGVRRRFLFASVAPVFVDAETGAKIDGFPAPDQKWKFAWPRKGYGQTYRKYEFDRRVERAMRADLSEFSDNRREQTRH